MQGECRAGDTPHALPRLSPFPEHALVGPLPWQRSRGAPACPSTVPPERVVADPGGVSGAPAGLAGRWVERPGVVAMGRVLLSGLGVARGGQGRPGERIRVEGGRPMSCLFWDKGRPRLTVGRGLPGGTGEEGRLPLPGKFWTGDSVCVY